MKILFVLLFLVSCEKYIFPSDWKRAEKACETNGGIKYYAADIVIDDVKCKNGAEFDHREFPKLEK